MTKRYFGFYLLPLILLAMPLFAQASSTSTITVGTTPYWSTLVGKDLYVNNLNSSTVSAIDTTTNLVTATIPVGTDPNAFTIIGTNLYVDNSGTSTVSVINTLVKDRFL